MELLSSLRTPVFLAHPTSNLLADPSGPRIGPLGTLPLPPPCPASFMCCLDFCGHLFTGHPTSRPSALHSTTQSLSCLCSEPSQPCWVPPYGPAPWGSAPITLSTASSLPPHSPLQPHWPPCCLSRGKLVPCLRAFALPVPSTWGSFSRQPRGPSLTLLRSLLKLTLQR